VSLKLGRILVADDDPDQLWLMAEIVSLLGYDVSTANSGHEALSALKTEPFDLVITDLDMPSISGLDLLEAIKGAGLDTDFLVVSGSQSIAKAVQTVRLGAANYLEKPITPQMVKDEVHAIFRRRLATGSQHTRIVPGAPASTGDFLAQSAPTVPPSPVGSSGNFWPQGQASAAPVPARRTSMTAREPGKIGRYEILGEAGVGGMGTVLRCRDPLLDRTVAVKSISSDAMKKMPNQASLVQRFYREARAAAKLVHPSIVAVYDFGEDPDGGLFLVMEFVEGRTLAKIVEAETRIAPDHAVAIIFQVADALEYAHRHGVIHRDVKPANVVVMTSGLAKILDFGIAGVVGSDLTSVGMALGSPYYISPEMVNSQPTSFRSDQFSMGVLFMELLTGKPLFAADTLAGIFFAVLNRPIPTLQESGVNAPPELQVVMNKLLERDPAQRYENEAVLLDDLWSVGRALGRELRVAVPR